MPFSLYSSADCSTTSLTSGTTLEIHHQLSPTDPPQLLFRAFPRRCAATFSKTISGIFPADSRSFEEEVPISVSAHTRLSSLFSPPNSGAVLLTGAKRSFIRDILYYALSICWAGSTPLPDFFAFQGFDLHSQSSSAWKYPLFNTWHYVQAAKVLRVLAELQQSLENKLQLLQTGSKVPTTSEISMIYRNTEPGHELRQIVVRIMAPRFRERRLKAADMGKHLACRRNIAEYEEDLNAWFAKEKARRPELYKNTRKDGTIEKKKNERKERRETAHS